MPRLAQRMQEGGVVVLPASARQHRLRGLVRVLAVRGKQARSDEQAAQQPPLLGERAREKARAGLLKAARDPDATMAGKFGDAIRQLGATLQEDPRLKATMPLP